MLLSSSPGEMHSSTTSSDTAKNSAFAQVTQVSTLESTCGVIPVAGNFGHRREDEPKVHQS